MVVVALDDLDVGPTAKTGQERGRPANQIHGDVDRQAHARRLKHGNPAGRFGDPLVVGRGEAGGGHDEGDPLLDTRGDDSCHGLGQRKVDHDVGRAVPGV